MENIIEVNNLYKGYRIYNRQLDRIKDMINLFKKYYRVKWALRDINFKINKGESIGVVGVNGSGKSTLLQILANTVYPTKGEVKVNGRIGALLELGAGFSREFTGRENIYLNGMIMGMTKEEIDEKLEEIISFAELGEYIDQPVRTYSNGMYIRLAFSIAINIDPDILLVDEVLAVGDGYFQAKCYKRIKELREKGVTIFFVSHDMTTVRLVTEKTIFLHKSRLLEFGKTENVVNKYISYLSRRDGHLITEKGINKFGIEKIKYGTYEVEIIKAILKDSSNKEKYEFIEGENCILEVSIKVNKIIENPFNVEFIIKDKYQNDVGGTNTHFLNMPIRTNKEGEIIKVIFNFKLDIVFGSYFITLSLHEGESNLMRSYEVLENAIHFEVGMGYPRFIGHTKLDIKCEVK